MMILTMVRRCHLYLHSHLHLHIFFLRYFYPQRVPLVPLTCSHRNLAKVVAVVVDTKQFWTRDAKGCYFEWNVTLLPFYGYIGVKDALSLSLSPSLSHLLVMLLRQLTWEWRNFILSSPTSLAYCFSLSSWSVVYSPFAERWVWGCEWRCECSLSFQSLHLPFNFTLGLPVWQKSLTHLSLSLFLSLCFFLLLPPVPWTTHLTFGRLHPHLCVLQ